MSGKASWIQWAIVGGVCYLVAGVGFGELAAVAGSSRGVFSWRLASWIVSAVVFGAHICHGLFQREESPARAAFHAAAGAAIGCFGLAVWAVGHSLVTNTGNLRLLSLALVVWPIGIGIPAFVSAWVFAAVVSRIARLAGRTR